jgi:uncharacterized protein YkwD
MGRSSINRNARRLVVRLASALVLAGALAATGAAATPVALAASHRQSERRAAAPAPCANANLTPTSENIPQIATATLCLINRQRVLHHERPLRDNTDLDRAATAHSEDMVAKDYFDHTSPSGEAMIDRIKASGYLTRGYGYEVGENIECGTLWLATPASTVAAWMGSPGHRANILNSRFVDSGIGVVAQSPAEYADNQTGATYTQDFGSLKAPNGLIS